MVAPLPFSRQGDAVPNPVDSRRFLSLVAWSGGYDREQLARLLAHFQALDLPTLRLRLGQAPPMVLERVKPAAATGMIDALVAAGGDGFAFTLDDLAALGPTLGIKELSAVEGALEVELREGLQTRLDFSTIQIIVRAHLRETVVKRREPPIFPSTVRPMRTMDSIKAEIESSVTRDVQTSDQLDIHTTDGSIYRIDGDRFGFGVLGELRGHGQKANMDSLLDLLCHLCPDAVVDTYFKLWRPPPGHEQLRLPEGSESGSPAFDFYSRWAAISYRHVMTG